MSTHTRYFRLQAARNNLTLPAIPCVLLGPPTRTQAMHALGLSAAVTCGVRQCHGLDSRHPPASLADGPGYYPGNRHICRLQWNVEVSNPGGGAYARYPGFGCRYSRSEVWQQSPPTVQLTAPLACTCSTPLLSQPRDIVWLFISCIWYHLIIADTS